MDKLLVFQKQLPIYNDYMDKQGELRLLRAVRAAIKPGAILILDLHIKGQGTGSKTEIPAEYAADLLSILIDNKIVECDKLKNQFNEI